MSLFGASRPGLRVRWRLWRYLPLPAQICVGFILPLVMVTGLSWIVAHAVDEAGLHSRQSEQSMRAVAAHGELLNAVLNAETGERGFIITGNPQFLTPYANARAEFDQTVQELRGLGDAANGARLKQFEALFQQWQTEVAEPAIAARRQSPPHLLEQGLLALQHLAQLQQALAAPGPAGLAVDQALAYRQPLQAALRIDAADGEAQAWQELQRADQALAAQLHRLSTPFAPAALREQTDALVRQMMSQLTDLLPAIAAGQHRAEAIIASGRGKQLVDQLRAAVTQSINEQELRHAALAADLNQRMGNMRYLSILLPLLGVGLGLGLLLLMQVDLIGSIHTLRQATRRIEQGDLRARVDADRGDEIGALGASFNQMATRLQTAEREATLLDGLQTQLIACDSEDELYAAAARTLGQLLPRLRGAIHLLEASHGHAERCAIWNGGNAAAERFRPEDCRALRLGRAQVGGVAATDAHCPHSLGSYNIAELPATACVPVATRDETLGIVHLSTSAETQAAIDAHEMALATTVAERLALALSNRRLTERLRHEAVRDPLTGLFNRRYLEETFSRELARMQRSGKPLAVIAVDVDHFKRFNDTYGHAAGDHVLKEVAATVAAEVRLSDIACRFGGEEFVLILPEANLETARQRAESVRQHVAALALQHGGQALSALTVSLGIAVFPEHGQTKEALLQAADHALYAAKRQGRNRVMISSLETIPDA